jgi:hypothetical protein
MSSVFGIAKALAGKKIAGNHRTHHENEGKLEIPA